MKKAFVFLGLVLLLSNNAFAQIVREPAQTTSSANSGAGSSANAETTSKARPAPQTFPAQYTGGLFGYSKKIKGTLTYDDANKRFVFRNQEGKEVFGLPYKSLLVVYGDSRSYQPTAAKVAGAVPAPFGANIPFWFVRAKHRYLIVQFDDSDSKVQGTASFKLSDKEFLQSVIQTLGEKAELKQRGDAFYRPREEPKPVM